MTPPATATVHAEALSEALDASRRPGRAGIPDVAWTVSIAIAGLLGLELAVRHKWVSDLILPTPSSVINALYDGFARGIYPSALASTVTSAFLGFALAFAISFVVAGLLASSRKLEAIVTPFIIAFQSLPKVAIAPLIVIWLGFNDVSKIVIVMVICFFPMLVNNLQGLKIRDRIHYELFKSLGASKLQYFIYLRTPAALPFMFAGLRIGIVFALIGSIVAEFVGSKTGIGKVLLFEKSSFNIPGVFAVLVLLMAVGMCLNAGMTWLERRLMFWAKEIDIAV